MPKNLIIKEYKDKIKKLKVYNDFYYNKDNPQVDDDAYDKLKKEIIKLEKNNPTILKKFDSVENIIGAPIKNKFKKIKYFFFNCFRLIVKLTINITMLRFKIILNKEPVIN